MMSKTKLAALVVALIVGGAAIAPEGLLQKDPSHDRNWKAEYRVLPEASVQKNRLTVRNVRDFTYHADGSPSSADFETRDYDLDQLDSAWYGISHFAGYGLAHTFLSFGFRGGEYFVVSIEARQEEGEAYHPFTGLTRNYELMYVVADERDVIGLRTHVRREQVFLYRLKSTPERRRSLLLELVDRINQISVQPEFYNTLTSNCTTSLLRHARRLSWTDKYLNYRILLPGYSDELLYARGLIDNSIPFEELRSRALIEAKGFAINVDEFSKAIRG